MPTTAPPSLLTDRERSQIESAWRKLPPGYGAVVARPTEAEWRPILDRLEAGEHCVPITGAEVHYNHLDQLTLSPTAAPAPRGRR